MAHDNETERLDVDAVLDGIMIAAPCDVSWESMEGDDRVRFCGSCKLNVYNTTAMTKREVAELMSREGRLPCLRIYRRFDGTLITDNCPVGLRKIRDAYKRAARRVTVGWAVVVSVVTGVLPVWGQSDVSCKSGNGARSNKPEEEFLIVGGEPFRTGNIDGDNALIPARDGPDTSARKAAVFLYERALDDQRRDEPGAAHYFKLAVIKIKNSHQDPKFAEKVFRDYAAYLKKNGSREEARGILIDLRRYKEFLIEEHRNLENKIDSISTKPQLGESSDKRK